MAKLPAIHLYPGDWLRDEVAGCSLEAQGLWLRMMFIMHDSDRYGYLSKDGLPMPPGAVARRCGCSLDQYMTLLTELTSAGVPSVTENGVVFSRRMVRDAEVREIHRKAGLLGGRPPSTITKRKPKANQNPEDDISSVVVSVVSNKTPAVKENETTALVPVERRADPVKRLVMGWKVNLLGIPREDKLWDKANWARCSAAASNLLGVFNGDIDMAAECMADVYDNLHNKAGMTVTLETIFRHSHDWRSKNGTTAHQTPRS